MRPRNTGSIPVTVLFMIRNRGSLSGQNAGLQNLSSQIVAGSRCHYKDRCLRGRKERFAKPSSVEKRSPGSNPGLSAMNTLTPGPVFHVMLRRQESRYAGTGTQGSKRQITQGIFFKDGCHWAFIVVA